MPASEMSGTNTATLANGNWQVERSGVQEYHGNNERLEDERQQHGCEETPPCDQYEVTASWSGVARTRIRRSGVAAISRSANPYTPGGVSTMFTAR